MFHSTNLLAQTKVGANLIAEFSDDVRGIAPSFGILIDHKVTPKSGIESGLYFRTYQTSGYVHVITVDGNFYNFFDVNEQYLTLPILYKFHNKIVNISAGPTFDFFIGWNQVSGEQDVEITDYSVDPKFNIGMMLKVSKNIALAERFSLEPEFRFNQVFSSSKTFGGFGVALKYELK